MAKKKKRKKIGSAQNLSQRPLPPNRPKNIDVRPREFLKSAEVKKLKKAASESGRHGFRNWFLVTMLFRHAFRVSELTNLRWEQVDLQKGELHVSRLKNGEPSIHYLEDDEIKALKELRDDYPHTDYVFATQWRGPLTSRTVHFIIARAGELAGLEFSVHPHMLRHSKGYQLAERGEDTRTIQAYLGHKNIQYSAQYTKVDPKRLKGLGKD